MLNYTEEKLNLQKKEENLVEHIFLKKKISFNKKFFLKKKAVWMSHEDAVVKLPKNFKLLLILKIQN